MLGLAGLGADRRARGATPPSRGPLPDPGLRRRRQGLLRARQEVGYIGLSGPIAFDLAGQGASATTNWWAIGANGLADTAAVAGNCLPR